MGESNTELDDVFGGGELNERVDPDSLLADIDLDADEISWRKKFIGFDAADERRLADLEPLLRDRQDEIAERFYENLTSYDGTLEIINRSSRGIEGLKQTQRAYLVTLATGEYDEAYFRNRARIGKLHELLEMPMKYYIGQYGVYYDLILSEVDERVQRQTVDAIETWVEEEGVDDSGSGFVGRLFGAGGDGSGADGGLEDALEETVRGAIHDGMADVLAVLKIVNLDMQVAADTYFESYSQQLDRAIEQRDALTSEVEQDLQGPIEDVSEASMSVAESAQEISDLAAGQADDVETIADETEALGANVEEIAATAETLDEHSSQAEAATAAGLDRVEDAREELLALEDLATTLADVAANLEQRAEVIDEAMASVDELAERAHVLGTNAGVEAKRENEGSLEAVASEIQTYAAKQRQALEAVDGDLEAVAEAVGEIADTTDAHVDTGLDHAEEAIGTLDDARTSVAETATGVEDVATAAADQGDSATEISRLADRSAERADRVSVEIESIAAAVEEQTANLSEIAQNVDRLTTLEAVDRRSVHER